MLGIGTDIVTIARIEAVFERQGQRFVERILAPEERHLNVSGRHLAKAFCASFGVSWCSLAMSCILYCDA